MMQKYAQRTLKPEGRAAHAIAARNACPTNKKFLATLHNFFQHDNFFKFLKFSKFSGSIFFTSQIIHRKAPCLTQNWLYSITAQEQAETSRQRTASKEKAKHTNPRRQHTNPRRQ